MTGPSSSPDLQTSSFYRYRDSMACHWRGKRRGEVSPTSRPRGIWTVFARWEVVSLRGGAVNDRIDAGQRWAHGFWRTNNQPRMPPREIPVSNVVGMPGQRLRRWPGIRTALDPQFWRRSLERSSASAACEKQRKSASVWHSENVEMSEKQELALVHGRQITCSSWKMKL